MVNIFKPKTPNALYDLHYSPLQLSLLVYYTDKNTFIKIPHTLQSVLPAKIKSSK